MLHRGLERRRDERQRSTGDPTCRSCPRRSPKDRAKPPFLRTLRGLRVDDRYRRTCLTSFLLAHRDIERVVDTLQRAIPVPQLQIIVHCTLWRDHGLYDRPFSIGQITGVTKATAVRRKAVFGCPHRALLKRESSARQGITSDSSDSRTSRIGSYRTSSSVSFELASFYHFKLGVLDLLDGPPPCSAKDGPSPVDLA